MNLSKSQKRLFDFLSDGEPHSAIDCQIAATGKRYASTSMLPMHMLRLREKIEAHGYRIESGKHKAGYRLTQETPDNVRRAIGAKARVM